MSNIEPTKPYVYQPRAVNHPNYPYIYALSGPGVPLEFRKKYYTKEQANMILDEIMSQIVESEGEP